MAVTSDASPFTSLTASPMESHDAEELPIELKIPLPSSSTCSEDREEKGHAAEELVQEPAKVLVTEDEDTYLKDPDPMRVVQGNAAPGLSEAKEPPETVATLEELAYLVESEAYQERQTLTAKAELERLSLSYGLDRRMICTFELAYGNMIDQYKTDDQAGFAGLFDACEQLKASCDFPDRFFRSPRTDPDKELNAGDETESQSSIERLPLEEQQVVLAFLTRARTESNFLSDRIISMLPTELTALTATYHPPGIDFSILQNHSHGKSHIFSRDSQMMKLSRRMDNLHRFHNQDPFFALLYGIFDSSARPGSQEHFRRVEVWSTICAKVMIEGFAGSRPGTDEFAIASLDAFVCCQNWNLKPGMEMYLMRLIVEGSFLLDTPTSQAVDFKEPLETHIAKSAIAESDFFDDALTKLLKLLTSGNYQTAVPDEVLAFAHAVLRRIDDPKLRLRARQFIVIRWYFATFVSSLIVYPEVRGLMMTQHIGESARRLILQRLVVRLQEQVFDVILPWNSNALVKPEIRNGIMAIFDSFDPPLLPGLEDPPKALGVADDASSRFLMLTPLDVVGLVEALCPDRTSPGSNQTYTAPMSDRPSTAGSSTLVAGSSVLSSAIEPSPTADDTNIGNSIRFSVTEPPDEHEGSRDSLKGQLKEAPARSQEIPKDDGDITFRRACQKLKQIASHDVASTLGSSQKAWTFVYYSTDGSTLSLVPKQEVNVLSSSAPHATDPVASNGKEYIDSLKTALIPLFLGNRGIGQGGLGHSITPKATPSESTMDPLEALLEMTMNKARSALNFVEAHTCWATLNIYRSYLASKSSNSFRTLLQDFSVDIHSSIDRTANIAKLIAHQCRSLVTLQSQTRSVLTRMEALRNALRIKMWYVSDVRHSATYEEALYVTRALRSMASSKKPKQATSIQIWARQRLRGSNIHDRAEAQTLEAMVAQKNHGGLSKLADEQVDLTLRWLTRKSIENFCKGEERIHRFCYEIQRSVGKIAGASLLESPVLWSSSLFKREKSSFDDQTQRPGSLGSPFNAPFAPPVQYENANQYSPASGFSERPSQPQARYRAMSPPNSLGGFWNGDHSSRGSMGLGLYGSQPTLPPTPTSPPTSWSANHFTSSPTLHNMGPPLSTGLPFPKDHSRQTSEGGPLPAKKAFAEQVSKTLYGLLVSDLGYLLWNEGSETDSWVNTHLVQEQRESGTARSQASTMRYDSLDVLSVDKTQQNWASGDRSLISSHVLEAGRRTSEKVTQSDRLDEFPFPEAYTTLLQKMSLTQDPYAKLHLLYELEDLILKSMDARHPARPAESNHIQPPSHRSKPSPHSKSVPRTKTTSLEEVIANCTERRAGTLRLRDTNFASSISGSTNRPAEPNVSGTDDVVNAMVSIFKDSKLRPTTLFRDLQYIAAFIPSETLDHTAQGKAFWDAGLAALALKEDLCENMITRANTITAYHVSPHNSLDPAAHTTLASTSLRDAANLWLITAKEGSPVAAREIGLFYLTHPELLPRVTMPLSKARDVFKSVTSNDMKVGDKERGALDPYTFAVVFHWMEVAANGGDQEARDFLKGNGELSGGR